MPGKAPRSLRRPPVPLLATRPAVGLPVPTPSRLAPTGQTCSRSLSASFVLLRGLRTLPGHEIIAPCGPPSQAAAAARRLEIQKVLQVSQGRDRLRGRYEWFGGAPSAQGLGGR